MSRVPSFGDLVKDAIAEADKKYPVVQYDPAFSLERIAESYVNEDWDALTEASLGRIYQHHKAAGHKSFAIVTAFRGQQSPKANNAAMTTLKSDVRRQGYGFSRMTGVGQEENGGKSKEPSIFVHGMSLKHAVEHGKKHDQHSIIYSGPETKGKVHLVHLKDDEGWGKKAGDHTDLGDFHPQKTGQYYSQIRNKHSFTFEAIKGWSYEGDNISESEVLSLKITQLVLEKKK